MNIIAKLLNRPSIVIRFDAPGLSKQERRRLARMQARTAPQQAAPVNHIPDRRITRNEWLKDVYGGLAFAPEVWKSGRLE